MLLYVYLGIKFNWLEMLMVLDIEFFAKLPEFCLFIVKWK